MRDQLQQLTGDLSSLLQLHPIMMVTAFVVLASEGAVAFKVIPGPRKVVKAIHSCIQLAAVIVGAIGISAVFRYHNQYEPPIANVYSLHAWMGIITYSLYFAQWLGGLVAFVLPVTARAPRGKFVPYHAFAGTFLYVLGLATASLGILEKVTFLLDYGTYGYHAGELYLADFLGLTIWVTGAAVLLTLLEPWKKALAPESEYATV
eukprot:TRINITY_DN616_c0_g1_i3.p1 TRINITY_DN616_c0_g1~~TRINITY_DN616_c0_g1_i3.p1  ORF type:complete len:205 (-),score=35.12 TRINITY_DN616_c0_g1_i3:757-1371(-)